MRFRNALIEIVEELRMRREHDVETEDYVKKLLDAKGTLEHDLELERRKSENLQDKLFKQEGEIRRKFETQLTVLEEEKRKAEAKNVYEESEIKGLRDEIKVNIRSTCIYIYTFSCMYICKYVLCICVYCIKLYVIILYNRYVVTTISYSLSTHIRYNIYIYIYVMSPCIIHISI